MNVKEKRLTKASSIGQLVIEFGITKEQAEEVWDHPNAGHVINYSRWRRVPLRRAKLDGKLFKLSDESVKNDGDGYAYAWAVTAYEAWRQCRPHISTHPEFHQCKIEVVG